MSTFRPKPSRTDSPALLTIVAVVAALYFGREFFLPIALAILFVFLLAPLARRLEKFGLGRAGSVIATTLVSFSLCGALAWMLAAQLLDLANEIPKYQSNLNAKIVSLNPAKDGPLAKVSETFRALAEVATKSTAPNETSAKEPMKVEVVKEHTNVMGIIRQYAAPILSPLGSAAVVAILVIFMLLQREDLRDRIIHLVARGKLHLTTQALDEAGEKVSRYLLAQLVVNVTYGIPIGIGLWFIGIPNAFLWALLATLLRFLPYIGPWIAAAFPILLSLAISTTWREPLMTLGLFVVMEVISNNIVEPWLYGYSTGLSSLAVIVSAVFWTWLWDTPGLFLATPVTVCIAVFAKYIPSWSFLDVLLGDRPPIAAHQRLYQRLLALDEIESEQIVQTFLKENPDRDVWDGLFFPVLQTIDADISTGTLDDELRKDIHILFRELIANCGTPSSNQLQNSDILVLPARNETDELCALMLHRALALKGVKVAVMSSASLSNEMVSKALEEKPSVVCICTVPPGSTLHAAWLVKRIHADLTGARIVVACWSEPRDEKREEKLKAAGADYYEHTFAGTIRELIAQSRCAESEEPAKTENLKA